MDWPQIKAEFEWDGSLRDLYVLDTDAILWQKALDFLRATGHPLTYLEDGAETDLPAEVAHIFRRRLEAGTLLSADVRGLRINCHFFTQEQIEFDIDPREISDEVWFGHPCEFIRGIGRSLARSVLLTPEMSGGEEEKIILRYLPASDEFQYTPDGIGTSG